MSLSKAIPFHRPFAIATLSEHEVRRGNAFNASTNRVEE